MAQQTPYRTKIVLQPGHIAISKKWKDQNIYKVLTGYFNVVKVYELDGADFYLPNLRIVYLSEGLLVSNVDIDVILHTHANIIVADRNTVTVEVFSKLQVDLLKYGLQVLPVGHINEVALLLHQLSLGETISSPGSVFRKTLKVPNDIQLQILQSMPGLGSNKAKKMLEYFGTIQRISFASIDDLIPVVGVTSAWQVHRFFNNVVSS